jgi:hypothetical protein
MGRGMSRPVVSPNVWMSQYKLQSRVRGNVKGHVLCTRCPLQLILSSSADQRVLGVRGGDSEQL